MNIKKLLITFFVLTFVISWSVDIFRIITASQSDLVLSNESYYTNFVNADNSAYSPILISIFVFGPTIAAFITMLIFKGKRGLKELVSRIFSNPFSLKWFLVANAIHLFLVGLSLVFGFITSGFVAPTFTPMLSLANAIPFLIYLVIFTGIAEEIGWRGVALPYMQKLFTPVKASIILGIIWGIWHVPLMIYANSANPGVIPSLIAGLLAGTAGWSIVVTWFYNKSRSLMLTFYLHGFGNFLVSYLLLSSNYPLANLFYGFAPWIIVFLLEKKYGKEYLNSVEPYSYE